MKVYLVWMEQKGAQKLLCGFHSPVQADDHAREAANTAARMGRGKGHIRAPDRKVTEIETENGTLHAVYKKDYDSGLRLASGKDVKSWSVLVSYRVAGLEIHGDLITALGALSEPSPAEKQIERLASFLLERTDGPQPGKDGSGEGAVDVAIRVIRDYQRSAVDRLADVADK